MILARQGTPATKRPLYALWARPAGHNLYLTGTPSNVNNRPTGYIPTRFAANQGDRS
jgi:hypothetical protein